MGWDEATIGDADRGPEEAVAVLEHRASCLEDVLSELGAGIAAFAQERAELDWVGAAQRRFSAAADELVAGLRAAESALEEGLGQARGAASSASFGSAG